MPTVTDVFNQTKKGATLQIRNVLGRVVFSQILERGTEQMTVDLRQARVASGIYFISVSEVGVTARGIDCGLGIMD